MKFETKVIDGKTWIYDERNNRASIDRWGDEERAIEALKTLKDCSDCSDCSDCFDCSDEKKELVIPVIEDIHKKVYDAASADGALDMSDWHKCDTTHCRGGWVTTLAGEAGRKLEQQTSCLFAAMQIYKASGYEISPCRFFDSDEKAMEDMKQLAGQS